MVDVDWQWCSKKEKKRMLRLEDGTSLSTVINLCPDFSSHEALFGGVGEEQESVFMQVASRSSDALKSGIRAGWLVEESSATTYLAVLDILWRQTVCDLYMNRFWKGGGGRAGKQYGHFRGVSRFVSQACSTNIFRRLEQARLKIVDSVSFL